MWFVLSKSNKKDICRVLFNISLQGSTRLVCKEVYGIVSQGPGIFIPLSKTTLGKYLPGRKKRDPFKIKI